MMLKAFAKSAEDKMDYDAIDKLQALYFKTRLATADPIQLAEAAQRIARNVGLRQGIGQNERCAEEHPQTISYDSQPVPVIKLYPAAP